MMSQRKNSGGKFGSRHRREAGRNKRAEREQLAPIPTQAPDPDAFKWVSADATDEPEEE